MRLLNSPEKFSIKTQESGQVMLEYILVLVLTVSIVLAFSKKISKPFGQYSGALMGSYLGCLLDKGILPSLGSDEGGCSEEFRAIGDNPFTKSGGSSGGGDSADKNASKNKTPSDMKEMADSRSGNSRKGRNNIGRTGSSSRLRDAPADASGGSSSGNENVTTIPNALQKTQYYKVTRMGNISRPKNIREIGLMRLTAGQRESLKRQQEKVSTLASVEVDEKNGRKKFNVKPPAKKTVAQEASEPMTFGKFVRFLIMGAIILAILIFLGNQINQVSQSWEKN